MNTAKVKYNLIQAKPSEMKVGDTAVITFDLAAGFTGKKLCRGRFHYFLLEDYGQTWHDKKDLEQMDTRFKIKIIQPGSKILLTIKEK